MPLVKCPTCRRKISDAALACPHCGHPIAAALASPPLAKAPKASSGMGCIGTLVMYVLKVVVGTALLLGVIMFILSRLADNEKPHSQPASSPEPSASPTPSSPSKANRETFTAKKDCWVAVSPEKLSEFGSLALQKDYVAMQRMENAGHILLIPEGEVVFNEHGGFSAGLGGYEIIRRMGETRKLYAVKEFLD